jgi:hypothetical protein
MRMRWVLWLAAILLLGGGTLALGQEPSPADLLKTADDMIQAAARIRGLKPKAPIARGVKSRAEITEYLNEQVKENYDRDELQEEGKLLQILGLIPESIDYREFVLKLYSEQVAGFYDTDRKTFYIASWLSAAEQKPVMVHELDHALQDQYFDVNKIVTADRRQHNDDRGMAHEALWEGDATVVMLNYELEPVKRTFSQLPDLAFAMRTMLEGMQSQFPVFKDAPAFLQETLFFPYGYGASFLQKAWAKSPSWEFVNKIYSDLPSSTEQIMHAEKYFGTRDEPKPVDAEARAAKLGSDWKVDYKNVLGEFSLSLLLNLQLSEERAKRCAAGWGGDQVLLLRNGSGKTAALVDTVWDSDDEADEFYQGMQVWFEKRFPNARKSEETPTGFNVAQEKEISALRHEGLNVRFIIGLPQSESEKLVGF